MVRLYQTFSIYIVTGATRYAGCCALVRGVSSTSNLLEPHHYKDSKVCRGLSHEFGVVRLYGTFSIYIVTEIAKCVEFCHMSSGWFDCTKPSLSTSLQRQQGMQGVVHLFGVVQAHRTSSSLLEPHHYKDSKVCRVLSHEFGVVRPYRTFSVYIVTGETRSAGCLCTSSGCFKHIEPHRIFPNHIITEIAKCVEFCHMSSGWFDCTEPFLSTSLQR